ncbi:hypothetical protein PYCC9005_003330 [Savitreella phatthalungensis]
MNQRRKTKRAISFSSSSGSSDGEITTGNASVSTPKKAKKAVTAASTPGNQSDSDLSEAVSEELELSSENEGPAVDEDDADDNDGFGDPDEDEEDIINDMMRPLVDGSKKTARQRGVLGEGDDSGLLSLPNETLSKSKLAEKELTAEELALKRSENARRRKNLTEKKLDEEKQEVIDRLLHKQAHKTKTDLGEDGGDGSAGTGGSRVGPRKQRPLPKGMIRWTSTRSGNAVGFPVEVMHHRSLQPLLGSAKQ